MGTRRDGPRTDRLFTPTRAVDTSEGGLGGRVHNFTPWNDGREQGPEADTGGNPRRERVPALTRTLTRRGQGGA